MTRESFSFRFTREKNTSSFFLHRFLDGWRVFQRFSQTERFFFLLFAPPAMIHVVFYEGLSFTATSAGTRASGKVSFLFMSVDLVNTSYVSLFCLLSCRLIQMPSQWWKREGLTSVVRSPSRLPLNNSGTIPVWSRWVVQIRIYVLQEPRRFVCFVLDTGC